MKKLKDNFVSVVLIIAMVLSSFLGIVVNQKSAFAITQEEADAACNKLNLPGLMITAPSGNMARCAYDRDVGNQCKALGGVFPGVPDDHGLYSCFITPSSSSGSDNSGGGSSGDNSGGSSGDNSGGNSGNSGSSGGGSSGGGSSSSGGGGSTTKSGATRKGTAEAAILQGCASAEAVGGEGVKCVILTVVHILSVLVGIVGIIGIVIVGIQYLTAGGNEEQTRKAKRRLYEIIIGIVAYALVAALLNWLLPSYKPGTNSTSLNDNSTTASSIVTPGV